jgi:hypothetical protein
MQMDFKKIDESQTNLLQALAEFAKDLKELNDYLEAQLKEIE